MLQTLQITAFVGLGTPQMLQITEFAGLGTSQMMQVAAFAGFGRFKCCELKHLLVLERFEIVKYCVCWFWNISNAVHVNDSVCWSWKALHAVIYNICWPCNVPQPIPSERGGRLDLGVRNKGWNAELIFPAYLLVDTEGWNPKSSTISLKVL